MNYLENIYGINYDEFLNLVDNFYEAVWIYDNNYTIIYTNSATERNFGKLAKSYIGKNDLEEFYEKDWDPRLLPLVYKNKSTYISRQNTPTNSTIQIATPIFDIYNNIKYVILNVRHLLDNSDFHIPSSNAIELNDVDTNVSDSIFFNSTSMSNMMKLVQKICRIDATVLITGESGTGKTMLAKYIHNISERKSENFVSINCASLPENLIESQLFGYTKGAFTGAVATGKTGLFKQAHKGTIFLDEISELSYGSQAKLLHVLQSKEFTPIGASSPEKVDVRIITATNIDLKKMVEIGRFREDLYYRLNVFEVSIPPLRERGNDIEALIYHFLHE
ncbi:sigma-54 interaction domain-containing protein [Anaeromicrobium sediminis]|uniref:Sigma-54 factor interaction domain-containing protein n=1 Tax=Anaeromicrobium sediminis TaxID=1478221 RepID=A0A267MLV1_9FIRM|nr:sigma 54-interacting transcriptional regulator [Anaeromicrobium sediminis]PAB59740.1 hypothetical protein CCE28_09240 [Anaeromicrobium sediminis]